MDRIFAISDIHGCFRPFYELITSTIKLRKKDKLILLGDYIDRGEQSKEVIDLILELKKAEFDIITLTGNHETMLTDSYNSRNALPLWLMNSGSTTLTSFGIKDIRDLDEKYIKFFTTLEYFKIIGEIVFVHAGFDDSDPDPFSDKVSMIWECHRSYQNPLLAGKTIIHGHRPNTIFNLRKMLGEKDNVLSIDTGCVYEKEIGYGVLTALEATSMTLFSVPNS